MLLRMYEEYGPPYQWPLEARIFDNEGDKFRSHIQARGWEQAHIPIWCQRAQAERKSDQGDTKKSLPGGFYALSTPKSDRKEAEDLALMNVACHFTGLRWMDSGPSGFRKPGWCTKFESLTETSHFDQVWCDHKCKLREMNRTFEIQMVTADLPTEDLVRLVMSELQDRQIGTTRMTIIWPERPLHSEELGPAKIVVVVQSEGAQEGALIFHQNARFNRYS